MDNIIVNIIKKITNFINNGNGQNKNYKINKISNLLNIMHVGLKYAFNIIISI